MEFISNTILEPKYYLVDYKLRKGRLNIDLLDLSAKQLYRASLDQGSITSKAIFPTSATRLQKLAQYMSENYSGFGVNSRGAVTYSWQKNKQLIDALEFQTIKITDQDEDQLHRLAKMMAQMKVEEQFRSRQLKNQINNCKEEYHRELAQIKEILGSQYQKIEFERNIDKRFKKMVQQQREHQITINQKISNALTEVTTKQSKLIEDLARKIGKLSEQLETYNTKLRKIQQEVEQTGRLVVLLDSQSNKHAAQLKKNEKKGFDEVKVLYQKQIKQIDIIKKLTLKSVQFLNANNSKNPERGSFLIEHSLLSSRIKKIGNLRNLGWSNYVKNVEIPFNTITKFSIKQSRTESCNILTGITSLSNDKSLNQRQFKEDFIVYSSLTGNVCVNNDVKNIGRKIQNGEVIDLLVDTQIWEVQWKIGHQLVTIVAIPEKMRSKNLFLNIKMRDNDDIVQINNN